LDNTVVSVLLEEKERVERERRAGASTGYGNGRKRRKNLDGKSFLRGFAAGEIVSRKTCKDGKKQALKLITEPAHAEKKKLRWNSGTEYNMSV